MEQVPGEFRHFLRLAREDGFGDDFGHVEMLVSKAAEREVWPLVAYWLQHLRLPAGAPMAATMAL
ncbi:hypothetical protein D3C72_1977420 [compost metagenome]